MRQVTIEHDINIAVNGCSWFATSTQKGPFMAMLISHSGGTYLIHTNLATLASTSFYADSCMETLMGQLQGVSYNKPTMASSYQVSRFVVTQMPHHEWYKEECYH